MQTPPWDGDDTYDAFDNKGRPLANPDIYIPADKPGYTGYNQESMRGQVLTIRAATGSNITVSFYFSLALGKPVITGGAEYDWNIANCNKTIYHWKDPLTQEPGAMTGPTISGAEDAYRAGPRRLLGHGDEQGEGQRLSAGRARASSRSRCTTRSSTTAASGTAAPPTW